MNFERARVIVGDMMALIMDSEGVPGVAVNLDALRSYTLAEMVEANRVVREPAEVVQNPDGSTSRAVSIHCADRLTAAIYTALHYDAQITGGDLDAIVRADGAALLLLVIPNQESEGDGDDE